MDGLQSKGRFENPYFIAFSISSRFVPHPIPRRRSDWVKNAEMAQARSESSRKEHASPEEKE